MENSAKKYEDIIYKTLSRTEWKTPATIQREIEEISDNTDVPKLGQIYFILEKGEHEGWAEMNRINDRLQYRIKEGGLRKTSQQQTGIMGWFFSKFARA